MYDPIRLLLFSVVPFAQPMKGDPHVRSSKLLSIAQDVVKKVTP